MPRRMPGVLHRLVGPGLVLLASPALAGTNRTEILLDGDPNVRSINSEEILLTQAPPARATTEFGSAVAFGDVDGDGFADAIVGQRADNKVFVYLGSALPRDQAYFGDPNAADIVIQAPSGGSDAVQQFGFSVAAFDLDGDQVDDILVGAPFSDPGGKTDAGLAFVVMNHGGFATGLSFPVRNPPAGVDVIKITRGAAAKAGDLLGFAVGAGPLRSAGDSFAVVTARGADAVNPARTDAGAAFVIRGSTLGAITATVDLSMQADASLFGENASDAFGESVAVCDVDGLGPDPGNPTSDADLLIGAIFGDGPGNAGVNRGEVSLFMGEDLASGSLSGSVVASSNAMRIYGASDGDDLGYSVACGDLNGDFMDDVVAGAIFADGAGEARPSSGELYVFKGRPSEIDPNDPSRHVLILAPSTADVATAAPAGPDLALFGATTADQLGFAAAVGDVDGDGVRDLLASARRFDRDQTLVNVGATYLLLGSDFLLDPLPSDRVIDLNEGTNRPVDAGFDPGSPIVYKPAGVDSIVVGASKDDHSGFAVAAGDMNGDGSAEVMIGAIGDLTSTPGFRGEAYVLSYADADGDGASDLIDLDSDNDGISDEDELNGTLTGGRRTEPFNPDTDGDGLPDGLELGLTCAPPVGTGTVACDDPNVPFTSTDPNLPLHFVEDADPSSKTDPLDQDTDDDGLPDGWIPGANGWSTGKPLGLQGEDRNLDGALAATVETDPTRFDTDLDGLPDGLELGLTGNGVTGIGNSVKGTDTSSSNFKRDADAGASTTNPRRLDSDGDGIADGVEDRDKNGAVDGDLGSPPNHQVDANEIWTETDPADADTDRDGLPDGVEDRNHNGLRDAGETNPLDQDTDDDGLPDGWIDGANGAPKDGLKQTREGEDLDLDGVYGPADNESSPLVADSDGDGLLDGVEAGMPAGGGVDGRNGTPGEAADGTDRLNANTYAFDMDPNTFTSPADPDTDNDGLPDGFIDGFNPNSGSAPGGVFGDGRITAYEGEDINHNGRLDPGETNPADPDTDVDGLRDGVEQGVTRADVDPNTPNSHAPPGLGGPATEYDVDDATVTNPLSDDSDNDGLSDGQEDNGLGVLGGNGRVDPGETDPGNPDSDGDGLFDALERGVVMYVTRDTDPNTPFFTPDADPNTMTNAANADTDGGGTLDGTEDANHDGKVDALVSDPNVMEQNPNDRHDDDRTGVLVFTDPNNTMIVGSIMAGSPIFLRLDDDTDENLDPNVAETVGVICVSTFPDTKSLTLTAVGPDTGVFFGTIPTNTSDPNQPGQLAVGSGNAVTCTYTDAQDPYDVRPRSLAAAATGPTIPEFDITLQAGGTITWAPAPGSPSFSGSMAYNLYRGDPITLRQTGVYTQQAVACDLADASYDDAAAPAPGAVVFYLAAGLVDGLEGPLGTDSAGRPRRSTLACAP